MFNWTSTQRNVAFACFACWMLDAFDFFILVFVLSDLAAWFHTDIASVSISIMLTLAVRPLGALLFGRASDKLFRAVCYCLIAAAVIFGLPALDGVLRH